jgi:protease I
MTQKLKAMRTHIPSFLLLFPMTLLFAACAERTPPAESPAAAAAEAPAPKEMKPRVAFLVGEGFHDGETYMTMGYLINTGHDVTVIGTAPGTLTAYNSAFTVQVERSVNDVDPNDFDALVLPGGKGPAAIRNNADVQAFVKAWWDTGRPTAAICHGPQVLISAGVMEGLTSTGIGGIKDELEAAGVTYIDRAVVTDQQLITSRDPDDLNDFSKAIAEAIRAGRSL